ncbi:lysophospholipid acyltransferase family protein [Caballeronia sp. LZ001]|uniref:lysophospholipid acyltransferase family protein n=1 Tax=Caballeronia sp. LZ001 TaxID=3038553 RepID=UPI00285D22E8|nr:lysophospholipid acyltransferase family protein [Caballeronia sp. LZ001]MDR5804180.1 lysophospholipid acyltransferase family protein [Caballeronia sp. LZ001]
MNQALRKLRLLVHLLYGMWVVARRFPRASVDERSAMYRAWSLEMLRLSGMKLVVHNDEARLDRGVLVVGNHVSWMDIYVINAWRPTPFVSKAEIRNWPVVGWLAHQLGTVFVQREKRSDAKRIMHELSNRLLAGEMMCVFPEGTTSDGQALLPFHANMFQAAVSASCPVQPVCIMYEDAHGKQSLAPAYIGDMTLSDSLDALLNATPLTAHLYVCNPLAPGADRRLLASEAQAAILTALDTMRSGAATAADPMPLAESLNAVSASSRNSPA